MGLAVLQVCEDLRRGFREGDETVASFLASGRRVEGVLAVEEEGVSKRDEVVDCAFAPFT